MSPSASRSPSRWCSTARPRRAPESSVEAALAQQRVVGAAHGAAQPDRPVEGQGDDVDPATAQLADHPRVVGIDDHAASLEDQAVGAQPCRLLGRDRDLVPVAQRHRQAVDELLRAVDEQAGPDQPEAAVEVQHVRFHRHRDHPVGRADQRLQPVGASEVRGATGDADIDLVAVQQRVTALEVGAIDGIGRPGRRRRPARTTLFGHATQQRAEAEAFTLAADQPHRAFDQVLADDDHGVAREQLRAFAVRGQEGPLRTAEPLRPVDDHALAGHAVGQRIDLAFAGAGPVGIEIDQATSRVLPREGLDLRRQPPRRLLVKHDEVLGRRDADHDFAQRSPLVVGPEAHQTRAWMSSCGFQ